MQGYFSFYHGTLTTPACMGTNWVNFLDPLHISKDQLAKFRTLKDASENGISDNFRPVQPLNDRVPQIMKLEETSWATS